jgi:hypothetical protein
MNTIKKQRIKSSATGQHATDILRLAFLSHLNTSKGIIDDPSSAVELFKKTRLSRVTHGIAR